MRALQSVVNQTFKDFEIIIVDDGSVDDTKELIKKFFQTNKAIKYRYIYQKNSGSSAARNNAVKNSSGKYLAFLDSDDEWSSQNLDIQYMQIQKLNAKFISSSYTYSDFIQNKDIITKKYIFNDFLFSNKTSTPCTIVEKKLFNEVGGFPESQRYSEDYNLWLKLSKKEPMYKIVQPALVRLHKNAYGESGLSANMLEMEKGELSNYSYLMKNKDISITKYILVVSYSIAKFLWRILKVTIKRVYSEIFFKIRKK